MDVCEISTLDAFHTMDDLGAVVAGCCVGRVLAGGDRKVRIRNMENNKNV
jgi:hypothetical protein